ncbi:hypothetical protein RF55_17906 [Lasius niger]|uniref:DDE Tnp4 domain-containing protein n=1 Tax=Lasius niger TaxID=67767 RepID=A0A0J7K1M1_LASNI|nr:hypothetical protein RF55_17906 [Lasius niger]
MAKTLFAGGEDVCILVADEYILEVFGPYFADGKNNDASILTSIMRSDANRLRSWLQPNDVFVVDRGFRDCLEMLEDLGLITKMPHFLREGSQHTTSEANESRLIPYVGNYMRIVSALCNAFRPPRTSDDPNDMIIAERMLRLSQMPNLLQERVEREVKESIPSYPGTANARSVLEPLVVVHMSHPSFGIWDIQDTLKDFKNDHPNPTHNTSKIHLRTFQTGLTMSQVEMATNLMANNLLIEDSPAPTPNSSITDCSLSHCEFGEYCNGIIREAGMKVR